MISGYNGQAETLSLMISERDKRIAELEKQLAEAREEAEKWREWSGQNAVRAEQAEDRAETADRLMQKSRARTLEDALVEMTEAWKAARKTLPPDRNLNAPWSQAIAIMDEAVAAMPEAK